MLSRLLKLFEIIYNCCSCLSVLYEIITGYSEYEPKHVSLEKGDVTIASIKWFIDVSECQPSSSITVAANTNNHRDLLFLLTLAKFAYF